MSKLRNKDGTFKKGHHKVAKKNPHHAHHKHHRKNPPLGLGSLARIGAKLGGAGRVARVLVVRA